MNLSNTAELLSLAPAPMLDRRASLCVFWSAKAGSNFALPWFFYQAGVLDKSAAYSARPHEYRRNVLPQKEFSSPLLSPGELAEVRAIQFVRDPFRRVVTSFVHFVLRKPSYSDDDTKGICGDTISFARFLEHLGTLDVYNTNLHLRMQHHPAADMFPAAQMNIIDIGAVRERLPALERTLGLRQSPMAVLLQSRKRYSYFESEKFCGEREFPFGTALDADPSFPAYRSFYNDGLRDRVIRLYAADFEKFGFAQTLSESTSE